MTDSVELSHVAFDLPSERLERALAALESMPFMDGVTIDVSTPSDAETVVAPPVLPEEYNAAMVVMCYDSKESRWVPVIPFLRVVVGPDNPRIRLPNTNTRSKIANRLTNFASLGPDSPNRIAELTDYLVTEPREDPLNEHAVRILGIRADLASEFVEKIPTFTSLKFKDVSCQYLKALFEDSLATRPA